MTDDDLDEVLELMRLSLGESSVLQRSPNVFRWKHEANPFGRSIALVATSGEQVVGLRTFMRWNLQTRDGQTVRCVRAVDTATHPQFRRKGIFRKLTEEALELATSDGVDMVFNTPNEQSKAGYLTMGWREVGPIGALVRPSVSMLSGSHDSWGDDGLEGALGTDRAVPEARHPLGLRTPRDDEYFHWRFRSHPTAKYATAGTDDAFAVVRPNVRRGRKEVVIADLYGDPRTALDHATKLRSGAYLATWFTSGSPERKHATRKGFIPIPWLAALTLVMRPLRQTPIEWESMSAWDSAVSDFELL